MMLAHDDFRVVHVSTHVSLRKALDLVKRDRILEVIRIANDACHQLGIKQPRIAVAGLNPHASDGGLFGTEDLEEIAPAVEDARREGLLVGGPIPPDTVFSKARGGQYDVVVAMYHDQGHIPMKLSGFVWDEQHRRWEGIHGVNITFGLPIIRTSVDHGTAFGKAGKGTASADSMREAIRVAVQLARVRGGVL
jgi:4-hydroxythreonine-4-phosphate dehydrogenase